MKEIPLMNCNRPALVDDEDYEALKNIRWTTQYKPCGNAYATCSVSGTTTTLRMHRVIMDAPKGIEVDHRDGNGLNNQRANLRLATDAQNSMNKKKAKNMTSKYKGVFWAGGTNPWRACIRFEGKLTNLGRWNDEKTAGAIYNFKCRELFGEFALPNEGISPEEEMEAVELFRKRKRSAAFSRFLGVSRSCGGSTHPWKVQFYINGKQFTKSSFPTEEMAARAYDKIIKEMGCNLQANYD